MKRENNEVSGSSRKRAKFNEDDLWSDSDSDVDDFLLQASQIVEEKKPMITQFGNDLSGYHAFNKLSMVASTQFEASIQQVPSTSYTNHILNGDNIYEELQKLRKEVVMKDGEVSILRCQLKQTKEEVEKQHLKKASDAIEKLNVMQKERDRFCTELDFKNMEIVNLRRKLANVTKNFLDATSVSAGSNTECFGEDSNSQMSKFQTININNDECDKNNDIVPIIPVVGIIKPLNSVIPLEIFESNANDNFPKLSQKKQAIDDRYLHSLIFSNSNNQLPGGIFTYYSFKETLKIKHFFDLVRFLKGASEKQLEHATSTINQIFLMTYTFLRNHLEYLKIYEGTFDAKEIRDWDINYLQHPNRIASLDCSLFLSRSCDKSIQECGIQCRQGVSLLSAIYPYSSYLQHIIINNKLCEVTEQERQSWIYNFSNILSESVININLLKLLLNIVKIIGQMRLSNLYMGLLCSICDLLSEILQSKIKQFEIYGLIHSLIKEIILTNPTYPVFFHLSAVFKSGSTQTQFLESLCLMPSQTHVHKKVEKEILVVNDKCCTIEIYFNPCREKILHLFYNGDDGSINFQMHLNLIQFTMNCISCNIRWLYHSSDFHVDCQREYYKLMLEVIHVALKKYKMDKAKERISDDLKIIVKLAPKVLQTIDRKFGELIEVNQQYNAIFKTCQALIRDLLPYFNDWNEVEVEFITKSFADPTPSSVNWDLLQLESLKL